VSSAAVVQIHTLISLGLAAAVCGAAVKFGDDSARRIGGSFLLAWLGSLLAYRANAYSTEWEILAIDVALLIYFAWVSIRWRRLWTLPASAFMAIIVASHVATMIDLRVTIDTFNVSVAIWSYGILACIAFGTGAGWRERRRLNAAEERP
jgi:hypothetical protein